MPQYAKVAKISAKKLTKQTNANIPHSKNVQKHMEIDSKIDGVIGKNKNNCKTSAVVSVQTELNKYIRVLEVKKTILTFEAKLCSLKEKKLKTTLLPRLLCQNC